MMVDRGEWEALRRENDNLRQQFALAEKRCVSFFAVWENSVRILSWKPFLSHSLSCLSWICRGCLRLWLIPNSTRVNLPSSF